MDDKKIGKSAQTASAEIATLAHGDAKVLELTQQRLQVFKAPKKVGKYDIKEKLGQGTCGIVYKGYDPFVQREVAIKIALSEPSLKPDTTRKIQRDFFVEAHAAGKLQHPHIVALYDAGIEADISYIVMEYIEGESLLEYCRSARKRLTPEQVIECMYKCCKALDFSHKQGVIHRDIKPSNIMLRKDGDTKLMDFSIAEVTQSLVFKPDSVIGSPSYMAPEQIRKQDIGPASDLYSLGAVMFQLLTGERPFKSEDLTGVFREILYQEAPKVKDLCPELPPIISDIVEKALRKNPQERFQTGNEFAAQLMAAHDRLRFTERKISKRENRDALKNLQFFDGFSDSEIDEIMTASTMLRFDADSVIIQEGDIDASFYILVRGDAEVRKAKTLIDTLHQGDCFGEIGFLMASKRTASIVAKNEVLVLKVNAAAMDTVSKDCQLHYYKVFTETLIYRLALTSARLSAKN
ncbi:MAG: protein kinase [Gammaproteobacteria bacterium]|nr:protein kinase [Gammaproteobacteria bacterium]